MFHVLAFNPQSLMRHCVNSCLFLSLHQPEEGYIENNVPSHKLQSLVFSANKVIRLDKAIRLAEQNQGNIAVRELSLVTLAVIRTLEFKFLSLFSNLKTRTESQVC